MAISVIASTSIATTGSATFSGFTSSAIDTSTATLIEVTVFSYQGAPAPALTHSKSGTFTGLTERISSSSTRVRKFYLLNDGSWGSGHTFTITTSHSAAYATAVIRAYAGTNINFHSESSGGSGTTVTSLNAGSVTPPTNGALITTGICYQPTISALAVTGESLAIIQHIPYAAGTTMGGAAADEIQTTAAALDPAWSWTTATAAVSACTATYYEAPPPDIWVSQVAVETVSFGDPDIWVTQLAVETVTTDDPAAGIRVSQLVVEVATLIPPVEEPDLFVYAGPDQIVSIADTCQLDGTVTAI
jgi:hypothetical protein